MIRGDECRFWLDGRCHRFPRVLIQVGEPTHIQNVVRRERWGLPPCVPEEPCGEFQRALDADIAKRKAPAKPTKKAKRAKAKSH